MDSEKLLRIINDYTNEENTLDINAKLQAIRDNLVQNTQQGFNESKRLLDELQALIE